MKTKYLLPLLLLFSLSIFAQGGKEKRERIKALKVSFLTTELNLTSEEAAKFWPVYNAFEEKEFDLRHRKMRGLVRKLDEGGLDSMTDKEALSYLNQLEAADEELFKLRQKLIADLKTIIGPVKILRLKKAEDEFNKRLLAKYKERKG
ncbi:sensor of ECF-type sigma factor [Flavobacterium sp.]|uniref:sensor of ECF-type sigma factor n=1 Tax=Flavobacterium sp. TaxID=239 RepID=UPI00261EF13F|nr:sensor of ECF-type sigma factor [Flavobacterium sp.]